MIENPSNFGIGCAERSCDQRDNILISCEHLGIIEIIPGGLHHLPKQSATLSDGNGMLNLAEKFSPIAAFYVFYENDKVVCIKTVDFAL